MTIALVSTCLNEINSIKEWKSDVLAQTRQPREISIVDAGSIDGTLDVLNDWASQDERVRLTVSPKCTVAQGRNLAIRHVSSDIIASTDMGCRLDPRWMHAIVQPLLKNPTIMVSAGYYEACYIEPLTIENRAECFIGHNFARLGKDFLPSNRSVAYRRSLWTELGGYPEDLTFCADDTVFALQIHKSKIKMECVPTAIVLNYRPSSMDDYCKEAWNYARGNGEALICSPGLYRFWKSASSAPIVLKLLYSLYVAIRNSGTGVINALKFKDAGTSFYIPYFIFRTSMSALLGYEKGMRDGAINCSKCRERLHSYEELNDMEKISYL
jgi:cellulose synthase/poly-beta-1,6-N-acetylglucosamine synthase-like glycosyltransferase